MSMVGKASKLVFGGLGLSLAALTSRAVWQQRDEKFPDRWLPWQCECGKVSGRARVPLAVTPSVVCNCDDCTGYARWMIKDKGAKDESVYGSHEGVFLFQKDVEVDAGSLENIQVAKMHEGSVMARFHAKCCASPLWFVYTTPGNPLFTVLAPRFAEADRALLGPVSWVLLANRKWPKLDFPKAEGTAFMDGMAKGTFMPNMIFNYFYGVAAGKADAERLIQPLLTTGDAEIVPPQ